VSTELEARRELDALVAERVMGWRLVENTGLAGGRFWQGHGGSFGDFPEHSPPAFSTDIASAWEVVERMRQRGLLVGVYTADDGSCWQAATSADATLFSAPTAPLAICRAAIAAVHATT
jgi:hypothetical protein